MSSSSSLPARRLLLAAGALVAFVLVGVSATITVLTRRELIAQVDARLTVFAPDRRAAAAPARLDAHDDDHDDAAVYGTYAPRGPERGIRAPAERAARNRAVRILGNS